MKKALFLMVLGTLFASVSNAQRPTRNPQPTPHSPYEDGRAGESARIGADVSRRSDSLKMTENFPVKNPTRRKEFRELIKPLYRHSTDAERAFMAPIGEDALEYREFLASKNTGVLKLAMDRGCASNSKILRASKECVRYTMPGAGSAYSFRFGDYRMHHISDINYRKNRFEALGVLTHGIMVDLGNVPIERVNLQTAGARYLGKLRPSRDFSEAGRFAGRLIKGFIKDGFRYGSVLPAKANSTYALRSIAYRGEAQRNVGGIVFNEMSLDRRRDVIVVFRVIRVSGDGDLTIVWKELADRKSPRLKPNKN